MNFKDNASVTDSLDPLALSEPAITGVEAKQLPVSEDVMVLPPSEDKAYGSIADTLATHYLSGIRAATVPFLQYSAAQLEERITELKGERSALSKSLIACEEVKNKQVATLAALSARLSTRPAATIAEQMLTTFGLFY
ncbi:MAG TPA: hypothetical protein VGI85_04860 [Chthoniobacterales bacterium]